VEPFDVRESLEKVPFKDAWRWYEHPVWRVDDFEVLLSIEVPYLRKKDFFWIHYSGDLLPKRTDNHAVSHGESEGMMELHILVDCFQIFVSEEYTTSGMMLLKGGYIEYVVVE
jgi:hypothetical protein